MSSFTNSPTSKKTLKFRNLTELLQKWSDELLAESSLEGVKSKLNQFKNEFEWEADYIGPTGQQAGHKKYDGLIERIFNATNSAIPKEQLLEQFLDALIQPELSSQAVCVFVMEAIRIDEKEAVYQYSGLQQRKLNPQLWQNFNNTVLPEFDSSVFFQKILLENQSLELWHSDYLQDYSGEFNALVGAANRGWSYKNEHRSFWVSALPLPAASNCYPPRALFILYPAKGDDSYRYIPPGAPQEWRCLHFLGIAYQQLAHHVRNMAEKVYQDRSALLNSLAPGLVHHEIGHQTHAITDIILLQRNVIQRLAQAGESQDLTRLAYQIKLLEEASNRLYEITDAFNNLEKQSTGETFLLGKVLKDVRYLCYHRLGNSAVKLNWDEQCQTIELFSDPPLLLHLLINLVTNAIIAFEAEETKDYGQQGRCITINAQIMDSDSKKQLVIRVENNGPVIPANIRPRIFEKGYTTRSDGHGQGLYISRLIAQYLGGDLALLPQQNLSKGMQVGFVLSILPRISKRQDLGSNR